MRLRSRTVFPLPARFPPAGLRRGAIDTAGVCPVGSHFELCWLSAMASPSTVPAMGGAAAATSVRSTA